MGNFGWSLPPGCGNLPDEEPYDDSSEEPDVVVDVDEAYSVATGDEVVDVVYFDVGECDGKWYMSAIIDCDTASFVDSLSENDGPYDTEVEAKQAGLNCAVDWMTSNDCSDYELCTSLKEMNDEG